VPQGVSACSGVSVYYLFLGWFLYKFQPLNTVKLGSNTLGAGTGFDCVYDAFIALFTLGHLV